MFIVNDINVLFVHKLDPSFGRRKNNPFRISKFQYLASEVVFLSFLELDSSSTP